MTNFLEFEKPIAELEGKMEELRHMSDIGDIKIADELSKLQGRIDKSLKQIYTKLTPWQTVMVARHPDRPHCVDYISALITEFTPLAGDRAFAEDHAIIGGLGRFRGRSVVILGHEKGKDTETRVKHNFGMARPEGYRKATRLMDLAGRFGLPVLSFVDTAGAYPGRGAEERGQSEAIAKNLFEMAELTVPIVCTVIGEGGSGGALAIGVGDRVNMLQYSTYSVISPEGCASILWKSAEKAPLAAEAMGVSAPQIKELGLINSIVEEPLGGAHRDHNGMAANLKAVIKQQLNQLKELDKTKLMEERYERLMSFGYC